LTLSSRSHPQTNMGEYKTDTTIAPSLAAMVNATKFTASVINQQV
jgi:hypothetical protein